MEEFDIGSVLVDIDTRLADDYIASFRAFLLATVLQNKTQMREARLNLEAVVLESVGRAELLGAFSTMRKASEVIGGWMQDAGATFSANKRELLTFANAPATQVLPNVSFAKALDELVASAPVTLRGAAQRSAARIRELYKSGNVIAFAKSAEEAVTARAKELVTKGLREGITEREMGRVLSFDVNRIAQETEAWTEGYARMAYRTNLAGAVATGRLQQARDPDIIDAIPALRFTNPRDVNSRPNHAAADGIILSARNTYWDSHRPPFGYGCRCELHNMTRPQLRRMGRLDSAGNVIESPIPHNAHPDPGF